MTLRSTRLLPFGLGALAGALLVFSSPRAAAQDTWTTPFPGVRRLERKAAGPLRIHALVVNLCAPGVGVRATKPSEKKKKTSAFGALVSAEAAVNGDFFNVTTYVTSGLAMGGGQLWPGSHDGAAEGFVAFGKNLAMYSSPPQVVMPPPEGATEIVGGRPQILKAGVVPASFDCSTHYCNNEPRTSAGFSADRRTLYIAVVDGRIATSIGVTMKKLGGIQKDLGAWDANSFDGGGSSTMWLKGLGVVNTPSDGVERTVANHLAIQSDGITKGAPMACVETPVEEMLSSVHLLDGLESTDVDGDGKADLCGRAASGFLCALSTGTGFGDPIKLADLSDDAGFSDSANWGTIRMGDIDGDGRSDVCARTDDGIRCWKSTGDGFGTAIEGPALSDADKWDAPRFGLTLRLADVNGDRKSDLCGRAAEGFRCWPSTGDGFGEASLLADLSDEAGYDVVERWGTIRMGDVDGDGRVDVCARDHTGMNCWLSTGDGFDGPIKGPTWSDADGWNELSMWSTLRLADIDGDLRADLCGRMPDGFRCHLSTGRGFGPAIEGPTLTDDKGWWDQENYLTIRMGDIDGDGRADLCGRSNIGEVCWRSNGAGFDEPFDGPVLSDEKGWYAHKYFRTISLADLDGDGASDLCARAGSGMLCWHSDGTAFPTTSINGPLWSNDSGWDDLQYYGTIRAATAPPLAVFTGEPSGSGSGGAGGVGGHAGASSDPTANAAPGTESSEGCGCRAVSSRPPPLAWLLTIGSLAAAGGARRRR